MAWLVVWQRDAFGILAACLACLAGCEGRAEVLGSVAGRPHFGAPALVSTLNVPDAKDQDITLTADLLEIYFMSERDGMRDLWTSTRASRTSAWAAPALVAELNTKYSEIKPSVSADGLRIWFYSGATPAGIWHSSRARRSDPWQSATPVTGLGGPYQDPTLDESERIIAVAELSDITLGWDLFTASRSATDADFGPLSVLPGVNTDVNEHDPFLVDGGLELFLASNRSGAGDLYWTRRARSADSFEAPVALDELNTPDFVEADPFLSLDHTTFFFSSTRSGVSDIYEAAVVSY